MKKWLGKLHKFLQLRDDDRRLLLHSLILMSAIRLGLWLTSFRTLVQILSKISKPAKTPIESAYHPDQYSIDQIVWAIEMSSQYMPGGVKCLARALTMQVLMRKWGYVPVLHIGVASDGDNTLEAHAWIEHEGNIAIGELPDLGRYICLLSL